MAALPTESVAVAAANEILKVPSPVIEDIFTVLVDPVPETVSTTPAAVPVVLRVTLATASVIVEASL